MECTMVEAKGKKLLTKAILALLVLGVLPYGYMPQAYCPLEDKIVKYIYLSDSRKTATVILSKGDDGFDIFDDRCQKGTEIGQWQPLKEIPKQECTKQECPEQTYPEQTCPIVVGYVNNCETGETDKYICNGMGEDADCKTEEELLMPFE